MSTITKQKDTNCQLNPELAEKKKHVEQLGYVVHEIRGRGYMVAPPDGVRFLRLRAPDKAAYFRIDSGKFDSIDEFEERWENLPDECRYADETSKNWTEYYRVDPIALAEWDRFLDALECFGKLLFDTPDLRGEYEQYKDEEDIEYEAYLDWTITEGMRPSSYWVNEIGIEMAACNSIFAVRWDGNFRALNLNGFEIENAGWIELEKFRSDCNPVDELHKYDAKKLSLRLLEKNHPDVILPSSERLSGETDVKWVLPGLVEYQGLTLTYAREKRGKTALVMSELWHSCHDGQCNVIYLAFEGANGLGARIAALNERFGPSPTFAVKKAQWDLSEPAGWDQVRKFVADLKTTLTAAQEAPTVVVFDTVGAALGTGNRITGAPEYFLGEAKRLQQDQGVALWLIHHENQQGGVYGFKGFIFDADVVTRITGKQSSADRIHKRTLGRHVESNKHLCTFRLEEIGSVPVAVIQKSTAVIDKPEPNSVPDLAGAYQRLVTMLDDAGAADGITDDELREVLNQHLYKPGMKPAALRQQRHRAKKALLGSDSGVLVKKDDMFFLVT